jgi:O-antigen/teichoic acid export membrane protein
MSSRHRIVTALAANGFGQAVTLGSQLVLTPLFFTQWGASLYGAWLLLSTLPAYLAMADLGFGSAAANDMAMQAGAGQAAQARQTFKGALRLALMAAGVTLLVAAVAAGALWQWPQPELALIPPQQAALALLLLGLSASLGFVGGVVQAGFRCGGFNGLGTLWSNLARLAEAVLTALVLINGQQALALSLAMAATKALMLAVQWQRLQHACPWLFEPSPPPPPHWWRPLWRPALAFMAFPLGNAMALQGPLLIVGATLGPSAVALFAAMRTLARLPNQITNVLNNAISPEISLAHGRQDLPHLRQLHRGSWAATVLLSGLSCSAIALLGAWVSEHWLGKHHHNALVLGGLLAVSFVSAVWNASSIVLTAVNAHARLGAVYLVTNALCLALAALGAQQAGWPGLLAGLLLAEMLLLLWLWPQAMRQTGDAPRAFVAGAWQALRAIRPGR